MVELDKWIEKVKRCEYLQEDELKALCEYVSAWRHCWPSMSAPWLAVLTCHLQLRGRTVTGCG